MSDEITPTTPLNGEIVQDQVQDQDVTPPEVQQSCKMAMVSDRCTDIIGVCVICKEPFCLEHQSEIEPDSCNICINDQTVEVKKDPLVDAEGVTHNGSVIHPIGYSYRTLMRRIVEMGDDQLIAHIEHVKKQVKDAELVVNYRRIDLSASQVELEERKVASAKKLRIKGIEMLADGKKITFMAPAPSAKTLDEKRAKAVVDVATQLQKMAKGLGIVLDTPEKLAQFAQRVQALGVKK